VPGCHPGFFILYPVVIKYILSRAKIKFLLGTFEKQVACFTYLVIVNLEKEKLLCFPPSFIIAFEGKKSLFGELDLGVHFLALLESESLH
jgi:hypothetical protein